MERLLLFCEDYKLAGTAYGEGSSPAHPHRQRRRKPAEIHLRMPLALLPEALDRKNLNVRQLAHPSSNGHLGLNGIESFQCSVHEPDPMLRWLLYCGLKLRMCRLAITVRDNPAPVNFFSLDDAQSLLRASGECLEHLVINLETEVFSDSPDGQQAALAHNPNLVSIYVSNVWCLPDDWQFSNSWTSLLSVLADIQPMHTKLQSINIAFITRFKPDITSRPWEQLDGALTRIVDINPRLILTVWISYAMIAINQCHGWRSLSERSRDACSGCRRDEADCV
ncbi:uncharacterized protein LAESUDRAFT_724452 [Laetiporus sulphureus 93-53]|uniref:Uncharacterized protein n=1 Tax=Laetiporus sulphureus 93-53 TaxID=1314785 RepID=A0A165EY58_9APHY|nr:uncharacterized protein LAESUDRAFT_724452 [Laetiporus sulphureus 93-53]KZT07963.1 hypothetical protein LAESUDRAFT_724452 [Laetiporus sulphureus 93-53]